jgi:holin-like protein
VIRALCILLGFELIGEALRTALHLPVPGPVIGMLALSVVLIARPPGAAKSSDESRPASELERVSSALIANMGLLFVPAGVGVITEAAVLKAQWLPILVGVLGSTLIGLVVTAMVMQRTLPASEVVLDDTQAAGGRP